MSGLYYNYDTRDHPDRNTDSLAAIFTHSSSNPIA